MICDRPGEGTGDTHCIPLESPSAAGWKMPCASEHRRAYPVLQSLPLLIADITGRQRALPGIGKFYLVSPTRSRFSSQPPCSPRQADLASVYGLIYIQKSW